MGLLTSVIRFARKSELPCLLLAGTFALTTTLAFSASPNPETIQATYAQNGKMISVTLTIDGFSNLAYPTNAVLLISIGLASISYGKWIKFTWKLWAMVIPATVLFLWIGILIHFGPF